MIVYDGESFASIYLHAINFYQLTSIFSFQVWTNDPKCMTRMKAKIRPFFVSILNTINF